MFIERFYFLRSSSLKIKTFLILFWKPLKSNELLMIENNDNKFTDTTNFELEIRMHKKNEI